MTRPATIARTHGWVFVVLERWDAREGDLKIFVKQFFIPSEKVIEPCSTNSGCLWFFPEDPYIDAREDIKTYVWVFKHLGDKRVGFGGVEILENRTADNGVPKYDDGW